MLLRWSAWPLVLCFLLILSNYKFSHVDNFCLVPENIENTFYLLLLLLLPYLYLTHFSHSATCTLFPPLYSYHLHYYSTTLLFVPLYNQIKLLFLYLFFTFNPSIICGLRGQSNFVTDQIKKTFKHFTTLSSFTFLYILIQNKH